MTAHGLGWSAGGAGSSRCVAAAGGYLRTVAGARPGGLGPAVRAGGAAPGRGGLAVRVWLLLAAGAGAPSAAAQEPAPPAQDGRPIVVQAVEVRGLEAVVPPPELPARLPLAPGEPYELERLEATERVIRAALAEQGRPWAQVEVSGEVDEAARTARVVLTVDPGPAAVFGPVSVRAEPPIEEEVVRARLAYRPGEPFRASALAETAESLFELPIVARATVEPLGAVPGDTVIPTVVAVGAARRRGFELEGTLSSARCLELAGFWRDRYFLDAPRVLSLGVGFSNLFARRLGGNFPCAGIDDDDPFARTNYFVQGELRQPWRGDPRTSILARGLVARESAPRTYSREGFGGRFEVMRRLRRRLDGALAYAPQRYELDAAGIYFCGNFGACSPAEIERLSDPRWLSPLEALVLWAPGGRPGELRPPPRFDDLDFRSPVLLWRPWIRALAEAAGVPTGSQHDYARGLVEAAATRLLGARFELAGRTRLGVLGGETVLPPQLRFYGGGVNSVRGLEQNLLGPKFLVATPAEAVALGCAVAPAGCPAGQRVDPELVTARPTGGDAVWEWNVEARSWLTRAVQLAAFADFGIIWRDVFADAVRFGDAPRSESVLTPGAGVRVLTRWLPLRVDVGYDPSGDRVYPLFTEAPDGDVVFLGDVLYDRYERDGDGGFREFVRRLQLHIAVGQPF